jgi:hypothetical protein
MMATAASSLGSGVTCTRTFAAREFVIHREGGALVSIA